MFRDTFYGQKISDYGRQNGRVDYHAFAASFDAVLCNGILGWRDAWEEWEQISGFVDNSEAIEEAKAKLEEVESKLEEVLEEKRKAESDFDDLERASENIGEILEKFDNFEYEANELHEAISWNDCETPNGDDLDSDTLERNLDCIDLWSMREAIEDHQSLVEEQREGAETALEELEEEAEELKKTKAKLEAEIEELELEDSTEAEYFQYFIISDSGARILEQEAPSEAVWYNEELDLYVWGVDHWGTSWDYVLTSIPCETYEQEAERLEQEAKEEAERKARAEAMTEEERAEKEAEELEELLDLWENDEPTEADLEEVTPCEPWHTPDVALTDTNGNAYRLGDTVHRINSDFVGKVTDVIYSDGLRWVEATAPNGSIERAFEENFEALEEATEATKDTAEYLTPISWDDVTLGDVVIGKAEASEYYEITIEGWRGSVTRISRDEDGTPDYFEAVGFGNEPREDGIEPNREWIRLEPHFFDLYRKSEGGDR